MCLFLLSFRSLSAFPHHGHGEDETFFRLSGRFLQCSRLCRSCWVVGGFSQQASRSSFGRPGLPGGLRLAGDARTGENSELLDGPGTSREGTTSVSVGCPTGVS